MLWKDLTDQIFVRKKEMLDFLESIDYNALEKRAEQAFSEPESLGAVSEELGSLEARLDKFRKEDKISLPVADKEIAEKAMVLEAIAKGFRENAKKEYERAVRLFEKEYSQIKELSGETLQSGIKLLRGLSVIYAKTREIAGMPINNEVEDYFKFHCDLDKVDKEVDSLISKYKQARSRDDVEAIRKVTKRIRGAYDHFKEKRKRLFGLNPAFKYENSQLDALEKELGKDMFGVKAEIDSDIAAAIEESVRIKNGGAPKRRSGPDKEKYDSYRTTIFLSGKIAEYKAAADELGKVSEDNYDISRKCIQIEDDIKERRSDSLRAVNQDAFAHLDGYSHCQKHLDRYSALCSQAGEVLRSYDDEQEKNAQIRRDEIRKKELDLEREKLSKKERIRAMELQAAEAKKYAAAEQTKPVEYASAAGPIQPPPKDFYDLFAGVRALEAPEDKSIASLGEQLDVWKFGWDGMIKKFGEYLISIEANPVKGERNITYLNGLRKALSQSMQNGTLTSSAEKSPEFKQAAESAIDSLDKYISKCCA